MKKIFTLLAFLCAATAATYAQSRVMVLTTTDGTQKTIDVDEVQSISHRQDKWEAYARGIYTFIYDSDGDTFGVTTGDFPQQQELTLYRYVADPHMMKLEGWGPQAVDFTFYWWYENSDTSRPGQVVVDQIDTGVMSDFYGEVIVSDYGTYYSWGSEGAWSTYYDQYDTFRFALVYSSALGLGIFDECFEVFQITEFL